MTIRPTTFNDLPALQKVLDDTGIFPSEMLPEMIAPFLASKQSEELWLTCEHGGIAAGFCYAIPEKFTEGTWNMLAIAVSPSLQGKGFGAMIVKELEARLRRDGHRILIVDTSGVDEFVLTRSFYRKTGYTEEARIRDFWAAGNDKITFWKTLQGDPA
jgi:ribosomal protein S18 acetylase RimI-like enzyme